MALAGIILPVVRRSPANEACVPVFIRRYFSSFLNGLSLVADSCRDAAATDSSGRRSAKDWNTCFAAREAATNRCRAIATWR